MNENVIYNLPVTVDNSKERGSFMGLCRSFYWKLSRDYREVRSCFTSCDEGFELRTSDKALFVRALLILDLSLTSFTHYRFMNTYVVVVNGF